jgi:predicted ATP-binding protein involved in virulence
MRLVKIKIKELFDLFSYEIDFNQDENLTIITGPNGYGKTTILNIIYNLFNGQFYYFQKLAFKEIIFYFDNQYSLEVKKIPHSGDLPKPARTQLEDTIIKEEKHAGSNMFVNLYDNQAKNLGTYEYNTDKEDGIKNQITRYLPFLNKISPDSWLDERTNRIFSFDDILYECSTMLPPNVLNSLKYLGLNNEHLLNMFHSFPVYLIKEQRLVRQHRVQDQRFLHSNISYTNAIQDYAIALSVLIRDTQVESLNITQQLDSSFPKRLLESNEKLSENEFIKKFELLKEKFEKLQRFGLLTTTLDVPSYKNNAEDAKVLTVYLSDSEKKTAVFDDLLYKIELFTTILNQKRFAFKSIQIDKNDGFIFKTYKGKQLSLTDLSSGEQHEIILLYRLLFETQPNTLVLIDEPEISLHVEWQHAFVDDLMKIAKLKNIRFLIATHSPMIIHNHFDLSVDLFELTQKQEKNGINT